MNTTSLFQHLYPIGWFVWLLLGLPLWLLLIMHLRRKRKISRWTATIVNTLSIAGSFTWNDNVGWFLVAVVLFLPVGFTGALIAETTTKQLPLVTTRKTGNTKDNKESGS